MNKIPLIVAHRGASSLVPENTLMAFKKAIDLGVDGIELDVQMTRDGVLVVFHDERVERTTNGKGLLRDYTLNQARKLDAGQWFNPEFRGEKIPTLAEVLQLVNGRKILLIIDIKTNFFPYPDIEKRIIKLLKVYNLGHRAILSSANHLTLLRCKGAAPDIKTGLFLGTGLKRPWIEASVLGADSLIMPAKLINEGLVQESRRRKIQVAAYGVNRASEHKKHIQVGTDVIITDRLFEGAVHGCKQND